MSENSSKLQGLNLFKTKYQQLNHRERLAVHVLVALICIALLWLIGLAPAMKILIGNGKRQLAADTQLIQLRSMAKEAQDIQQIPKLSAQAASETFHQLENTLQKQFGNKIAVAKIANQATLTLNAAPNEALTQWLTQTSTQNALQIQKINLKWDGETCTGSIVVALQNNL